MNLILPKHEQSGTKVLNGLSSNNSIRPFKIKSSQFLRKELSQNFTKTLSEFGQIFKAEEGVSFEQALAKSANCIIWPLVSLSFSSYTLLNTTAKFLLSSTFLSSNIWAFCS